jgi:hypothetical protein
MCSKEWQAVRLINGKIGYIKSEYLKSPLDYRVKFKKEKNKWKLSMFQEGE